jgi:hypothetical protein
MIINKDHVQHLLELYANQDGTSYKNKDVKQCMSNAMRQIRQESREQLDCVMDELKAEFKQYIEDWMFEDDRREAKQKAWKEMISKLRAGETVEISEEVYDDWLGCLPPLEMKGGRFAVSEAVTVTSKGEDIYTCCIQIDDKFYAKYLTIEGLRTWNRENLYAIESPKSHYQYI